MKDKDKKVAPWTWWIPIIIIGIGIFLVILESKEELKKKESVLQSQAIKMDYPLCANQKSYNFWSAKKQIKIPLHNSCWSGNIMLPPQVKFVVDTPVDGDLEYKFWNGERLLVPDGSASWMGDISHSSFRLRGNGEAIITIERM